MIEELERLVGAVDRLDWRFIRDTTEWAAYFHPDWQTNPERIVLADGAEPSRNEIACIMLLRHGLPALPALLRVARAAEAVQAELGWINRLLAHNGPVVANFQALERARVELIAALADLNGHKSARV